MSPPPVRPPIAWFPVAGALATCAALLAATAARYGYHRDELYFRMLEPSWGYVDQPPLTPLLARAATAVLGDSVWALRVPAMGCLLGTVLLAVLTTRELGGGRGAQVLCAWGLAFSTLPLVFGHTLLTASLDLVVWTGFLLLAVRALLRGEPRLWLVAGALVGVGLYNKQLIVLLLVALAVGLLAVGPRDVLLSGWLWLGLATAVVVAMPNVVYQATHEWPQVTMARALSERGGGEARALLLPLQVILLGLTLTPIWISGLVALWRRAQWRPVRSLAVAYPVVLVLTLASAGQFYYSLGLIVLLFAAGCIPTVDWVARLAGPRRPIVAVGVGVNAVLSAVISLPLVPVTALGATPIPAINQVARDSIGWAAYVRTLAEVYAQLPAQDRARSVLYTSNYGEAGALHRFGPEHGLPAIYSGHNELWHAGPPPDTATVVVAWTQNLDRLRTYFAQCEQRAVMDNGVGVDNEEQGSVVAVCRDPVGGWSAVWPHLRHHD